MKRSVRMVSLAEDYLASRPRLLTFYDFPAEHWQHIRTTNAIESTRML